MKPPKQLSDQDMRDFAGWMLEGSAVFEEEVCAYLGRTLASDLVVDLTSLRHLLELLRGDESSDLADEIVNFMAESMSRPFADDAQCTALDRVLELRDSGIPTDFDLLTSLTTGLLRRAYELEPPLSVFVSDVLEGKRTRPKVTGPKKNNNFARDYKLWKAAQLTAIVCGRQLYTNNDAQVQLTAAEVISEQAGVSLDVVKKAIRKFKNAQVWGRS